MRKRIFLIRGAAVVLFAATAFMLSRSVCGNTPQDIVRTLEAQKNFDGALEVAVAQDVGQLRLAAFFEDRGTVQAAEYRFLDAAGNEID